MKQLPDIATFTRENLLKNVLKDKFACTAFIILVILYLAVFLASFISPYPKDYSNRNKSYCPPSKVYIVNEKGRLSLPYTYNYIRFFDKDNFETRYIEDRSKKYRVKYFSKGEKYKLWGFIAVSPGRPVCARPSQLYPSVLQFLASGVAFLWILCLSFSYPFLLCTVAVQLILRSSSGKIALYVGLDVLCLWEEASSGSSYLSIILGPS